MYRCLSMASKLVFHDVVFFINRTHQLGIDIIEGYNYKYQTYGGKSELLGLFEQFDPKIIINDVGNTSYEYMVDLTNKGYYIINFENRFYLVTLSMISWGVIFIFVTAHKLFPISFTLAPI